MSDKLITPLALISYPHLAEPQKSEDGKQPKYSCSLVFTPELLADPAEQAKLEKLKTAALDAINKKWPGKAQLLLASETFKKGFRTDATSKGYPEGSIYINVRAAQQPGVVYSHADPITKKPAIMPVDKIKIEVFPGVIVRASVSAFAYENSGNKGVSFGLNNVQKIRDGVRLDGRAAAEDEFDVDLSAKPADLESLI